MKDTDIRPKDNDKVSFTDSHGNKYEGLYIESEDLFFIGFENEGDFIFARAIESWELLK